MKYNYSEDEYDFLKEIFNIAMGQAAKQLSQILNSFIELHIPNIQIIEAEKVAEKIVKESIFSETEHVSAFRQSFNSLSSIEGEAFVIFNENTKKIICNILGIESQIETSQEIDFIMEITNLIVGATINGISNQLFKDSITFSQPNVVKESTPLQTMAYETFRRRKLKWDYTLLAKITFTLKHSSFQSDMIIFLTEKSIEEIQKVLKKLMPKELVS